MVCERDRVTRRCVFGCNTAGIYIHRFPHPIKKPELYKAWVTIVGNFLKEKDPLKIYKSKRVCNHHFILADRTSGHRLINGACPTINLGEVPQSINTIVDEEHNYSFARQASKVPLVYDENKQPAVPEEKDNPIIATNVEVEKPVPDNEVAPANNAISNINVDTHVSTEESTVNYEEPNHCYGIITGTNELSDGINEFLVIPPITETSLAAAKDRRNSGSNDCDENVIIESDNLDEGLDEYLISPTNNDFLPTTEQQGNSVAPVSCETTNISVDTNAKNEEFYFIYEGSNDGFESYKSVRRTLPDKSYDSIDKFLTIPATTKACLPTTKSGRNGVAPVNCETTNTSIDTNATNEDAYVVNEGSNDGVDTTTMPDKSYDGIDEFLIIPKPKKKRGKINRRCDNCKERIVGFRYKCLHCFNYNHCHKCEMHEAHPKHYMIIVPESPEFEIPDVIIEKMCDEFKPVIDMIKENKRQESILWDGEPVINNPKACDSDVDLPEDVKSLIRNEVTRVVKNKSIDKTSHVKVKRKKMPVDTAKKRKMTVQTATINGEAPAVVEIDQNDNVPDLVSVNNNDRIVDHGERNDNESKSTIATVVTDKTCPGAVQMALSPGVTQLIIEMMKDGEKVIYKYVDS